MKFIAGNVEFTDNMKQLLTNPSIFDRIIRQEPTILENKIWRKQIGLNTDGIYSGSVKDSDPNLFFRSSYLIYKTGEEIDSNNIDLTVTNVNSQETIPNDRFNNWGLVKVDENMYMLFIWIDLEQSYRFNLRNNVFNSEDWFIQVVI